MNFEYCKLEIFIPETHFSDLQEALIELDAGHIGTYDCCLSYSKTKGCWRPLEGSSPYDGVIGEICYGDELKVEVNILVKNINKIIDAIKQIHPYEVPVINVIPLFEIGV